MNQIRSPVLVHLDIGHVKNILKNCKEDNEVLNNLKNEIYKLTPNTSKGFPSPSSPKLVQSEFNQEFINDCNNLFQNSYQLLSATNRPLSSEVDQKPASVTVKCEPLLESTELINNSNTTSVDEPDMYEGLIQTKSSEVDQKQALVTIKCEPLLESTELINTTSMDESNIGNGSIQTDFSENILNDASSSSITDSIGSTFDSNSDTNLTSFLLVHGNDIIIEPFITHLNECSSEIVQEQALATVKSEPLLESTELINTTSMDESNICNGSTQSDFSENILNDASSSSITDSIGSTFDSNSDTNLTSFLLVCDNYIIIEPFITPLNECSSEIVQEQALVTVKCKPLLEPIELNNTTSMNESNMCNRSIQVDFSGKNLNDASSNPVIDLMDLTDPSSDTESTSLSHNIVNEKFNYTKYDNYVSLKMIVFNYYNYKIYHKQIMVKLAVKLKKNQLLWKFKDAWHTPQANLVKVILEDILKLINHMENKDIIFMGCLSIIFRKTVVSHNDITDTDLYNHFTLFTSVIEKCLMNINYHFWKTMFPNGWNEFCNGCLIVDLIIHGPNMSMAKYVNWNEIPSTRRFHNNLNSQHRLNKHNVLNNQLEKPRSDNSFMPSKIDKPSNSNTITHNDVEHEDTSYKPSILDKPNNSNTVTRNDGEHVVRERSINISCRSPSRSNKSTKQLSQTNNEKLAKRKKLEDTSNIPSILDKPNNSNTVTRNDGEHVVRKRSINIPCRSNKSTKQLPQTNNEKLAKRKKLEDTSNIPSILDKPNNSYTVTRNDGEYVVRERSINISCRSPSRSNKSTKQLSQTNNEKLAKRKRQILH